MKSFFYVARDSSGDKVTGTLEAADKNAALAKLKQCGRFPISLTEEELPNASAIRSKSELPEHLATPSSPAVSKTQDTPMNQGAPTSEKGSKRSRLAIASLVLGIIIWTPLWWMVLGSLTPALIAVAVSSILALVFGHVSRRAIRRSAGRLQGKGMALAGLILVYAKVFGIVANLMAMSFLFQSNSKKIAAAQSQIQTYEMALQQYALESGIFPTTEQGLRALIAAPTCAPLPQRWRGPYLNSAVIKPDPWGHPLVYICPAQRNPDSQSFDLYSMGPDGQPGTDDDVVNWDKAYARRQLEHSTRGQ